MEIIKFIPENNIIFFKFNNIIYKAKITETEKDNFIVYVFNFKKYFTINLNPKFIPAKLISQKLNVNLKSPLSGRIIKIYVNENDKVKKDQPLLAIESMKMENEIRADHDTLVKKLNIKEQDLVEQNQILIEFGEY